MEEEEGDEAGFEGMLESDTDLVGGPGGDLVGEGGRMGIKCNASE
jgi:hypothetical protein